MATLSHVSVEEYLRQERLTDGKNDYLDGEVIQFKAAKPAHARICLNIRVALQKGIADGPCSAFDSSLAVCIEWGRFITHPDITVVCGELQYLDDAGDVITNPRLITEVLSPSTRNYDRGDKAYLYRTVASLTEYVVIEQKPVGVEMYRRAATGGWHIDPLVTDPNAIIRLDSINVDLPVSEIYAGVGELQAE